MPDSMINEKYVQAVGGVVYRNGRPGRIELLLIKKRFGDWSLPKGRIEDDESDSEALARELREETGVAGGIEGLVASVEYIVEKRSPPQHKRVRYYLVRYREGNLRPGRKEGIKQVRWFSLDQALRRLRRERVRAVAQAAIEHIARGD